MGDVILVEDDKFSVTLAGTYAREQRFVFHFNHGPAQDYFSTWYRIEYVGSEALKEGLFGYSKQSVIESVNYLKEKGIELSLETEMWLAKENKNG